MKDFSDRLLKAVERAGIKRHGAGQWLASFTDVTVKAANKWLNGESVPRREKVEKISAHTGVRSEWLLFGNGQMTNQYAQADMVNEDIPASLEALLTKATPRSQIELEKIAEAAAQGRLTEDDIKLLKAIADRLAKKD
ncbi:hypothetical protein [Arsukibacterium indicum]|uniref:HTH cro/C1-type domain-containing protein n=1 Tax=Arsukibacterium indicum TaxID=2848612 RepID=A0ABS6MGL3_9GAMM|nr:hypothetical protein [Arsukibacterium indicum]MBV2127948.1 hypothetical protein [Arsukibacterium indicum]